MQVKEIMKRKCFKFANFASFKNFLPRKIKQFLKFLQQFFRFLQKKLTLFTISKMLKTPIFRWILIFCNYSPEISVWSFQNHFQSIVWLKRGLEKYVSCSSAENSRKAVFYIAHKTRKLLVFCTHYFMCVLVIISSPVGGGAERSVI